MCAKLIGSVVSSPPRARPGESIKVEVLGPSGESYADQDDVTISINGVLGPVQYLQFPSKGEHTLLVRATREEFSETLNVVVTIEGVPLIGSVVSSPPRARPGESIKVEVLGPSGESYADQDDVTISINGVLGPVQYLQFPSKGEHTLLVRATREEFSETLNVVVTIDGPPLMFQPGTGQTTPEIALLHVSQSPSSPYEVAFSLGSPPYPSAQSIPAQPQKFSQGVWLAPGRLRDVIGRLRQHSILTRVLLNNERAKVLEVNRRRFPIRSKNRTGSRRLTTIIGDLGAVEMPDLLELLPSQETPCYEWDFGDGSMETTTVPTVTHDYSYALDTDHVTRQFHVRCRIVHNNFEVIRTLLIHSAYVLCKRHGTIVPPIDVFPEIVENMFGTSSATMIVQNVEDTPLTITHEALVLLSNDPDALETPPSFVELGDPLILKPKSVTELAIIGPAAKVGFTVYYAGHAQDGTPVRFSATFDWTPISSSEGEQGWLPPIYTEDTEASWSPSSSPPWEIITEYFWDIISRPPDPDISITADDFFLDKKTGTLAITIATGINQPLKRERLEQAHNVMLTGLMPEKYLMSKVEHAPAVIDSLLSRLSYRPYPSRPRHALLHPAPPSPPEPGPVSEGQYCDPDNISDEDEAEAYDKQLVCQLVDEEKEYLIPGRFLNARKGDIVLSPGGAGLIGSLLRTVSPPQRYSHCGIMTRNYDEITHSTASEDRLRDYKTGTLEGSDGIRPDVVKYLWPGVVTQSVEAATHGESWVDPENGNTQSISSFAPHAVGATHNDFFEIVPPLVVKPDPLLETPAIRERLHGVATEARAVGARPDRPGQSHYRLYCYTDPRIGLTTVAGPEAGWAQDTFPSVCSSFIWMMLKKCGVHLETDTEFVMPQDLETSDLTQGAEVRPGTLDGLYTYAAQERMAAAEWLYNYVYYLAYDQAGWCGNFLTDAAPQAANEVTNTFVIDQPFKDWPFWQQSIGPADAVSPDNILLWDSPEAKGLYGYVEPLQYREPRTVKYKLSRWKKVLTRGEVTGTVRISEKVPADEAGKPVAGAFVEVYDGKSTYTDDNGFFTLSEVPAGWYDIKANKVVDGIYYSTRTAIKVAPPVFTVDLKLKPPAETFRLLQIYYEFYGVDEEIFDNEVTHAGPASNELELGPDRLTNSMPLGPFKWGGECQAKFGINAALLWDGSIEVNVQGWLYEGTDEETEDLDGTSLITLIVPRSETIFGVCTVSNTAEDCGDIAQLSITVKNNKNTN